MRLLGLLAALCLLAACGAEPEQRWIELARAEVSGRLPAGEVELPGGGRARYELRDEELWLVSELPRSAWKARDVQRSAQDPTAVFRALLPLVAVGRSKASDAPYRLRSGARTFAYEADPARFGAEPERFTTDVLALDLVLAAGEEPPETVELAAVVAHAEIQGGVLRFRGRRQSGNGFWVPAGEPRRLSTRIPPGSVLHFGTALEPLLGARAGRMAEHVFRIELDGAVLSEVRLAGDVLGEAVQWHEVPLPPGGVQRAALTFSVSGPPALTTIVDPLILPRERGTPGARPWDESRPDLVVFLADTLRADCLTAYGSTLGLTPEIDRFAASARVFTRAWSTAPHTLATHASLFTGFFPHQNGLVDYFHPLPGSLDTLAEQLARRGYRCVAVTDGVMVSQRHGLAQGFAWFDERVEGDTVERVRSALAQDDGRPLFLFVQSYAVHAPYHPSPEAREALRGRWPVDGEFKALLDEASTLQARLAQADDPPVRARQAAVVRELEGLYRARSADLDRLFARFLAEVDGRGYGRAGTLLFLADHGEAFLEHGNLFHANGVHEEELRVPLVVRGPRFPVGREERPVSLIDFAPTLAELAGSGRSADWSGVPLTAPPERRELFGFQSLERSGGSALAVIDAPTKFHGRYHLGEDALEPFHARYDLARDPGERANELAPGAEEAIPAELARRLARCLTPLVTPERSTLDAEDRRRMRDLGYVGDE